MTPARNNVRATRHFGIPARKSSPSAPLQPFPREKTRPTTAQSWPNREKTRPARPKTPKSSHFSRAGRTFSRFQRRTTEQGEFSPATTPLNTHHRDTTTQPPPQPVQNSPHNTHLKAQPVQNSPSMPTINENWPFLASRRILSRSQHRTTEQGEFSPATTPLNTHHRDTTTPTGTKPTQQRRRQRAQPGARVSTRDKTLPARPSNRSRTKKLAQQQPNLGQTAKKLSQRAQKHQNLAIFPEQGELFRVSRTNSPRRANFFAFPTPHHRAGRIFSRNNTTQHPSQGHHHPNRYKTLPATASPWPNREKTRPTRPRQRLSPGHESARAKEFAQHPLQPFPREKTRPATAQSWPNREKTLPTRPKTPKSSQFSRAGRTFSRFPNQFTPQGELFRADSTLNV